MVVRLRWLLSLLLVVPFMIAAAPPAGAAPQVQFEGSGWGHGVGMSQYGARGQALAGRGYRQTLAHYAGVGADRRR